MGKHEVVMGIDLTGKRSSMTHSEKLLRCPPIYNKQRVSDY